MSVIGCRAPPFKSASHCIPPGTLPNRRLHSVQSSCAHSHSLPMYHSSPSTLSFLHLPCVGCSPAPAPIRTAPSATFFVDFHPSNVPSRRTSCRTIVPLLLASNESMLPAGIAMIVCPPACARALPSATIRSCVDLALSHSKCTWTCPCCSSVGIPSAARGGDAAVDPGTHSCACTPWNTASSQSPCSTHMSPSLSGPFLARLGSAC